MQKNASLKKGLPSFDRKNNADRFLNTRNRRCVHENNEKEFFRIIDRTACAVCVHCGRLR
jgi:hypothetical protein